MKLNQEEFERISNVFDDYLRELYDEGTYDSFINNAYTLVELDEDNLKCVIACKDRTHLQYFRQTENTNIFKKALFNLTEINYKIEFITYDTLERRKKAAQSKLNEQVNTFEIIDKMFDQDLIEKENTFDNFVIGDSNSQAASACKFILDPKGFINIVYIYANPGLGKTHLLQAIYNKSVEDKGDDEDSLFSSSNSSSLNEEELDRLKCRYISTDDFINVCVKLLSNEKYASSKGIKIEDFKNYFYSLDCVMFDDIQLLRGKEKTQEVFFEIFNKLISKKKRIVLTSDSAPEFIQDLDTRLVSRFRSGLCCSIKNPEKETIINICKRKLGKLGYDLNRVDDSVYLYLAKRYPNDIRALDGAIISLQLNLLSFPKEKKFTEEDARKVFDDPIKSNGTKSLRDSSIPLTMEEIVMTTSTHFGCTSSQIKGKSRIKTIVLARHTAFYLGRYLLEMTYSDIANFFNGDHSTVLNGVERIEREMKTDEKLADAINRLVIKLTGNQSIILGSDKKKIKKKI